MRTSEQMKRDKVSPAALDDLAPYRWDLPIYGAINCGRAELEVQWNQDAKRDYMAKITLTNPSSGRSMTVFVNRDEMIDHLRMEPKHSELEARKTAPLEL